jgi:hypothetical protein
MVQLAVKIMRQTNLVLGENHILAPWLCACRTTRPISTFVCLVLGPAFHDGRPGHGGSFGAVAHAQLDDDAVNVILDC